MAKKRETGEPRLECFPQIMKDKGCGTFREVKGLAWARIDGS